MTRRMVAVGAVALAAAAGYLAGLAGAVTTKAADAARPAHEAQAGQLAPAPAPTGGSQPALVAELVGQPAAQGGPAALPDSLSLAGR